jgi:hypothetical protein
MIDPRSFIAEYVEPAIETWQKNPVVKHLAVHAITQVDVLAEIVALWTLLGGRSKLNQGEAAQFRDGLGLREPILAVIRDAHDSHKHGELSRRTAVHVSLAQRPEAITKYGFFLGHTFPGGPLTRYQQLIYVLNDETEKSLPVILHEAMVAWERELTQLGI